MNMDDQPDFEAPELADLVSDARAAYEAEAPTPSSALASLFEGEATTRRSGRRTLVRLVAATAAVLAATGSLAVAGALPGSMQDAVSSAADNVGLDLPDADGNHGAEVSEVAKDKTLQGCEHGRAVSAVASGKVKDKPCPHTTTTTEAGGPTTTTPEDDEGDADNHGKEVSAVAKDKTLEGCEHGRAVSAVASGTVNDKPCPNATTTTTAAPEGGAPPADDATDDSEESGSGNGNGNSGNGNGNGANNGNGQGRKDK